MTAEAWSQQTLPTYSRPSHAPQCCLRRHKRSGLLMIRLLMKAEHAVAAQLPLTRQHLRYPSTALLLLTEIPCSSSAQAMA